jgi:4,5-DOPA dioxygenase extradiol
MKRRDALKILVPGALGLSAAAAFSMKLSDLKKITDEIPAGETMPSIFIGHGSPMNAIEDNEFTRKLTALGLTLPTPQAVLVISAHWLTRGTSVAIAENPSTIYDFGGFPNELYQVKYPAKGSPEKAKLVQNTITKTSITANADWGLDHGAWTILKHIWPQANVPVFQMSIDYNQSPRWHYELAQELKALRKKGILIIGSGNIVHNLGRVNFTDPNAAPEGWASEFDTFIKNKIDLRDHESMINYLNMGAAAKIAVPTNDHYLPLLYNLGTQEKDEKQSYLYEGFHFGNISMRCVQIG